MLNKNVYFTSKNKKELQPVKDHCIENLFKENMNCHYEQNLIEEIVEIGNNNIIVKNINIQTLQQTCNDLNIVLKGNYLIKFENCKIIINDTPYIRNTYLYEPIVPNPIQEINYTSTVNLTFEKLHYENIQNIKHITELKNEHKKTQTYMYIIIFTTTLCIIMYSILKFKKKNGSKIITNISLPEVANNPGIDSSAGGVITELHHYNNTNDAQAHQPLPKQQEATPYARNNKRPFDI